MIHRIATFNFSRKNKKDRSTLESNRPDKEEPPTPIRVIVDGLLYDTLKAAYLTHCEIDIPFALKHKLPERFTGFEMWVCRTDKGNFFTRCFGKIIPIDQEEAKELLACDPDKYIEIFGEVEEA